MRGFFFVSQSKLEVGMGYLVIWLFVESVYRLFRNPFYLW